MRAFLILAFGVMTLVPLTGSKPANRTPAPVFQEKQAAPLFQSDSVIRLVIRAKITPLWNDRGESPRYHPVSIGVEDSAGNMRYLAARCRVRGHFRKQRKTCDNPPILINLDKGAPKKGTLLAQQNKLKLVLPCVNDELVMREYLLYRVYQLMTPFSMRARLARVILFDSSSMQVRDSMMGMLLEPIEQVAGRNNQIVINTNGLRPEYMSPSDFHLMAIFQLFAANTDWGIQYRHNIELIATGPKHPPTPVPYDFDMSGMVDAPYGVPSEDLNLPSIRVRRYRGYCLKSYDVLQEGLQLFNEKKGEIENLYATAPGLSEKYRNRTLEFIRDFYEAINDPKKAGKLFSYPCDGAGAGNVVIKGLRDDKQ